MLKFKVGDIVSYKNLNGFTITIITSIQFGTGASIHPGALYLLADRDIALTEDELELWKG